MTESKQIAIATHWDDKAKLAEIRKTFAPTLSELEFSYFVQLGKATGLNPFMKEIWAVKYSPKNPAQIFIGRDGYRRSAQRHKQYDYHYADSVYSNDKFAIVNGEVRHERPFGNRGVLLGAYAVGKRLASSKPVFVTVDIKEYDKPFGLWKTMRETMIKKVAEAQLLRQLFQEVFLDSYSDAESWNEKQTDSSTEKVLDKITKDSKTYENNESTNSVTDNNNPAKANESGSSKTQDEQLRTVSGYSSSENEPVSKTTTVETATQEQLESIHKLLVDKKVPDNKLVDALTYYQIYTLEELTHAQANHFISFLSKLKG